jgi:hypothetical protein
MPAELISATMHSANGFDRDVRGISLGFVATQRCSLGEKDTGERITQKWNAGIEHVLLRKNLRQPVPYCLLSGTIRKLSVCAMKCLA